MSDIIYRFTEPQKRIFQDKRRFKVINAGRRFGKSYLSGLEMLTMAIERPKSLVWYVAPTYSDAKRIMWKGWLKDNLPQEYVRTRNEVEMYVELLNGSEIYILGADKPDNLRGSGLDLLILDECAMMKPDVYTVLRPCLSDRKRAGRGIFISTPKGYNWFYDLYTKGRDSPETWGVYQYTTIEGGNVSDEEIEEARRNLTSRQFAQEYLASFETLALRVYDSFSRERNVCEPDPSWGRGGDIHVGMDFNVNPMTCAIAVQDGRGGGERWVFFDEIVEPNTNTQHVCDMLRRRFPKCDVWAYPDPTCRKRQTSAAVGVTDFEILKRNGFHVCVPRAPYPSRDKFNACNAAFMNAAGEPRAFIARGTCPQLRKALEGYTYKDDGGDTDKSGGLDHISDAMAYLLAYRMPFKRSFGIARPSVFGV